jgi:hypothetical protein
VVGDCVSSWTRKALLWWTGFALQVLVPVPA